MHFKILRGIALAIVVLALGAGIAQAAGVFDESSRQSVFEHYKELALSRLTQSQDATAGISRVRRGPRGFRGPRGSQGPQGAKGSQGAPGAQGPKGAFGNITYVLGSPVTMCPFSGGGCSVATASASCPPGMVVIGGGEIGTGIPFISNAPNPTTWNVTEFNEFESFQEFRATAVCAS